MQQVQGGRHCAHCQKTVIDFSNMSDAELLKYLNASQGNICGRLSHTQINKPIEQPELLKHRYWPALFATTGLLLGLSKAAGAQVKDMSAKIIGDTIIVNSQVKSQVPAIQSSTPEIKIGIHGTLTDENKNPIINANVTLLEGGTQKEIAREVTDFDGNYSISVPVILPAGSSMSVKFSYQGNDKTITGVPVLTESTTVNGILSIFKSYVGGLSYISYGHYTRWQRIKMRVRRAFR